MPSVRVPITSSVGTISAGIPVKIDLIDVTDPTGKYLYFLSYRHFDPVYDNMHFELGFPKGVRPALVTLRAEALRRGDVVFEEGAAPDHLPEEQDEQCGEERQRGAEGPFQVEDDRGRVHPRGGSGSRPELSGRELRAHDQCALGPGRDAAGERTGRLVVLRRRWW